MATSKNIQDQTPGAYQNMHACNRCGGLLIREGLFDLSDDTGHMRRWARRCVQCGNIVDPLILKRRAGVDLPALNVMSRRRWKGIEALTRKPASL